MARDGHPQFVEGNRSRNFSNDFQARIPELGMARNVFHGLMGPPPEPPRPIDPPVTGYMGHRQLTSLFPHQPQTSDMNRSWTTTAPQKDGLPSPTNETHALFRWQTETEDPWSQLRTDVTPGVRPMPYVRSGTRSHGSFSQYRDNNPSEVGSIDTGTHPSDSGYATKSLTPSVFSGEPAEYGQECSSVSGRIDELHLVPEPTQCSPPYRHLNRPRSVSTNMCDICGESFNCQSALKKHQLRHIKPHKCSFPSCPRAREGFATINDRDRHITSVHKVKKDGISKSWRCPFSGCRSRDKNWQRVDNFRSHLRRMHKDKDIETLVQKCDQECLVTEREPVLSPQGSCTSHEIDPPSENSAHRGVLESGSFISPQDLSEDSPNSTAPEPGNAPPGFVLPSGRRPAASLDSCGQKAEPFMDTTRALEKTELVQNAITETTGKTPHSEKDRAPSAYPPGSVPAKGLDHSKGASSNNTSEGPEQESLKIGQDAEGSSPLDVTPTDVSSTVAALSPEISKVAASLTPKFLSTLGIGRELNNPGPEAVVANKNPANAPNKHPDASGNVQTETASKLPSSGRKHRLGQIGHRISSENMNISSGSDAPLSDKVRLQVEELLKSGLSNLLARSVRSARYNGTTIGGNHGPTHAAKGRDIQCRHCKKVLPRDCDMNKHLKRHTRPFGCTFPNCNKLFGSKNDWKRHENTQHFQLEMWRCHERDVAGKECVRLFYRRETFQAHLRQHGITDMDKLRSEARSRRIGRNGQIQFWCGFCKVVVPLKFRGLEAWDERFNHIGLHFAQNKKIDEWIPVDSNRPKGETWPESGIEGSKDFKEPREAEGHKQDPPKGEAPKDDNATVGQPSPEKSCEQSPNHSPIGTNDSLGPKIVRYCCDCTNGPWSDDLYKHCPDCQHQFCSECRIDEDTPSDPPPSDPPPKKRKRSQTRS